jgi:hypothetical protein
MLSSAIEALYRELLDDLPADRPYKASDLRDASLPEPIAHFLRRILDQRVDAEMEHIRDLPEDWLDLDQAEIGKGLDRLESALRRHAWIPANLWADALGHAVEHVVGFLIRPARTAADFVFDDEEEARSRAAIERRLTYFSAYPYLLEIVAGYFDRKGIDELTRGDFAAVLQRIERELARAYQAEDWVRLIQPIFDVLERVPDYSDRGVPINLLRSFFEAKGASEYVARLDALRSGQRTRHLSREEMTEILIPDDARDAPARPDEAQPGADAAKDVQTVPDAADLPDVETQADRPPETVPSEPEDLFSPLAEEVEAPDAQAPVTEEPEPEEASPVTEAFTPQDQPSVAKKDIPAAPPRIIEEEPDPGTEAARGRGAAAPSHPASASTGEDVPATAPPAGPTGPPPAPAAPAAPPSAKPSDEGPKEKGVPLWMRYQKAPPGPGPTQQHRENRTSGEVQPLWMKFRKASDSKKRPPEPGPKGPGAAAAPAAHPPVRAASPTSRIDVTVLGPAADERDLFIEELFRGDVEAYERVMSRLAEASDWSRASQIIGREVFQPFKVNIYSDPAITFTEAVERRFRR